MNFFVNEIAENVTDKGDTKHLEQNNNMRVTKDEKSTKKEKTDRQT